MRQLIRRWLGIQQLEDELDALLKHYGITLEEQPKYKIKLPKSMGFKSEKK